MVDLLRIKLFVPHTRGILVSRPRLVELLNSRLDKELILIAAPAEFGKITLVITWLKQIDLLAAWRSVDEADNDLPRFLAYLATFLRLVHDLNPAPFLCASNLHNFQ